MALFGNPQKRRKSTSLLDLPTEIIQKIGHNVALAGMNRNPGESKSKWQPSKGLNSLCRANRTLNSILTPLLYSTLDVYNDAPSFLCTLLSKPELQQDVREIRVAIVRRRESELPQYASDLGLVEAELSQSSSGAPDWRTWIANYTKDETDPGILLIALLLHCPKLARLEIDSYGSYIPLLPEWVTVIRNKISRSVVDHSTAFQNLKDIRIAEESLPLSKLLPLLELDSLESLDLDCIINKGGRFSYDQQNFSLPMSNPVQSGINNIKKLKISAHGMDLSLLGTLVRSSRHLESLSVLCRLQRGPYGLCFDFEFTQADQHNEPNIGTVLASIKGSIKKCHLLFHVAESNVYALNPGLPACNKLESFQCPAYLFFRDNKWEPDDFMRLPPSVSLLQLSIPPLPQERAINYIEQLKQFALSVSTHAPGLRRLELWAPRDKERHPRYKGRLQKTLKAAFEQAGVEFLWVVWDSYKTWMNLLH